MRYLHLGMDSETFVLIRKSEILLVESSGDGGTFVTFINGLIRKFPHGLDQFDLLLNGAPGETVAE